jgi:excisionase family DNA binding protein
MDTDGYLTTKQAAKYLGVSEAGIKKWRKEGKLKARKAGRLVRFTKEDLDKVFEK